jgi:hypothetical protein
MISLYAFSDVVVTLVGLALVVAGTEIGWQLGVHSRGRGANNISIVEQCLFGLLALLVGFTFLMALTRFEARREAVLNEANAIGTTALRARFLPEPHRAETLKLLREYIQLRVEFLQTGRTLLELPQVIQRSNQIQEALWQRAKTVATKDNGMVPTGLFIQALNEMIDDQEKHLAALRNVIPEIVLLTLLGITAITGAVAGYAGGLEERPTRLPAQIMGVLVCAIIFVILDLDRPAVGFITVSQQPMIDTAASIGAFAD